MKSKCLFVGIDIQKVHILIYDPVQFAFLYQTALHNQKFNVKQEFMSSTKFSIIVYEVNDQKQLTVLLINKCHIAPYMLQWLLKSSLRQLQRIQNKLWKETFSETYGSSEP